MKRIVCLLVIAVTVTSFAQEILKQPSAFLSGKQTFADVTVVQVKR